MKIIVGISGASGAIYGIRLLEELKKANVESHLVISKWAAYTMERETDYNLEMVIQLADYHYDAENMAAKISSGSFRTEGMVIMPCSMKTLGGIANGIGSDLLCRGADVCLKERRKLLLVVRETPLNTIHLENMLKLSRMGTIIMPPVPAFYNNPETIDDIVNQTVGRVLDQFGIESDILKRWEG
ncbi:MAG: UbiX family flavin prenyltransferase [Anaerovoracaceae bacterium]|jgi:4-hydroxy-3-polyprenylbenzoate decarboxylase